MPTLNDTRRGPSNVILSDSEVTALLLANAPKQVPEDFVIVPFPPELVLQLVTWLLSSYAQAEAVTEGTH